MPRSGQRVRLRYRTRERAETERLFDPYGVVYHAGVWYAVGYYHLRDNIRTFRLDRISAAEPVGGTERFAPPADFDPLDYLRRSLANTPRAWTVVVTLFTSYEEAVAHLPSAIAAPEAVPDGVLVRSTTDSLDWFAGLLVGLECDFVIHEPPELREAVRHLAARLVSLVAKNVAP